MRYLFSRDAPAVLLPLADSRALLAFDFDGTLAPIVRQKDAACMRPETAELFAQLCRLFPCAVVSGRSQGDVAGRLNGAVPKYLLGNHGLEPGPNLEDFEQETQVARAALQSALATCHGVEIEDKRLSLAVHYRKARYKKTAREDIYRAVSALPLRMRTVPGKLVVNVLSAHAPDKGDALLNLKGLEQAEVVLYAGDDATDEDAFQMDKSKRLLAVRIGRSRASAAGFFLRNQRETDRLLLELIALRATAPCT